jgi:hypothetical protein
VRGTIRYALTTGHGLWFGPATGWGEVAGPREISRRFDTDLKYGLASSYSQPSSKAPRQQTCLTKLLKGLLRSQRLFHCKAASTPSMPQFTASFVAMGGIWQINIPPSFGADVSYERSTQQPHREAAYRAVRHHGAG